MTQATLSRSVKVFSRLGVSNLCLRDRDRCFMAFSPSAGNADSLP
jgi:hypothetical protein